MKTSFTNRCVTLISETPEEAQRLVAFATQQEKPVTRVHKKHKRHMFKRECPTCGVICKGNIGYGIHRAKSHPTENLNNTHPLDYLVGNE